MPFVVINAGGIPENLLGSELFGFSKDLYGSLRG
jgi:transcriptional regulator with PAS, ATPase and Fis domain